MDSKHSDSLDLILRANTAAELEAWDAHVGTSLELATLDKVVGKYLTRVFRGESPEQLLGPAAILLRSRAEPHDDMPRTIYLAGLSAEEQATLRPWFSPSEIERRGTWSLPQPLEVPTANQIAFVALVQHLGRYAPLQHMLNHLDNALDQRSPDTVMIWSVVAPLVNRLIFPYRIRTWEAGRMDVDTLRSQWQTTEALLTTLGVEDRDWFTALAPSRGWHQRSEAEHEALLTKYISGLQAAASLIWGRRFRLWCAREVYTAYARRARSGTPTRTATIRRGNLEAFTLAFGGDWLRLLRLIQATPSPQERIITDSPTPRIMGGPDGSRLSRVVWHDYGGISPMETRAQALSACWNLYDSLCAMAKTPSPSSSANEAYVLLDRWRETIAIRDGITIIHLNLFWNRGLSPVALPAALRETVDMLWGRVCLSTAPIYQVSNPFPLDPPLNILRPVIQFWRRMFEHCVTQTFQNGAGWLLEPLTLPGWMQDHIHEHPELHHAWTSPELARMRQAITQLGHWKTIWLPGEITSRQWRHGFESLRDLLTAARRAWAEVHLDAYISKCWRSDLETAAATIHALEASLNRQPKPQAVGQKTRHIVDQWMNGSLPDLYRALALPMPSVPIVQPKLPADRFAWAEQFANQLVARIGIPIPHEAAIQERWRQAIGDLLSSAFFAVQVLEARGEAIMIHQTSNPIRRAIVQLGWPEEHAMDLFVEVLHATLD